MIGNEWVSGEVKQEDRMKEEDGWMRVEDGFEKESSKEAKRYLHVYMHLTCRLLPHGTYFPLLGGDPGAEKCVDIITNRSGLFRMSDIEN